MKIKLMLLAMLFCIGASAQKNTINTTFIITKTTPYCGGANPPEEILAETRKKKIPVGEKFYIIKGWCNTKKRVIVDSLQMGLNGQAASSLKTGCYSVIDQFGYNKLMVDEAMYDMDCLQKLWETPLHKFEISKGKTLVISFNKQELCSYNKPCYTGKIALPM